ncbi:MAG TPA: hypothetical protein VFS05_15855 [Gemmatimonadaceae bacterium]|nr:hypothetical protein [Gemmatimonadaceae bacterium]
MMDRKPRPGEDERARQSRDAAPTDPETGQPPRGDAGQGARVSPEHPKGDTAPLPRDHPSRGTIDEAGAHD